MVSESVYCRRYYLQNGGTLDDSASFEKITSCESPKEAKDLGRLVIGYDEHVWNENRFEIVKLGNIHKFNQHPALANYLLETGNQIIVEASPVDTVWGIGLTATSKDIDNIYAWRGLNLLGFVLMEVRDNLQDRTRNGSASGIIDYL